jgi:putative transposase
MAKYKNYDSKFKAKIVMEVLKNEKTVNQIAAEYNIPPKNIINWKKIFKDNFELIFNKDNAVSEYKEKVRQTETEKDNLYRKIGELATENEWLKKKSAEFGLL